MKINGPHWKIVENIEIHVCGWLAGLLELACWSTAVLNKPFCEKSQGGMVVAELMTRAATFWPCYPWVSDPWGSPASCLLLANFGSSIRFYRIHLS